MGEKQVQIGVSIDARHFSRLGILPQIEGIGKAGPVRVVLGIPCVIVCQLGHVVLEIAHHAVAVKAGGPDPATNSKLRDVIAKAKANNMPNDTIDRSIKKAAGDANAANYESITYEGYGPSGTAIIVETLTDNRNRTASNVRNAFTKGSGNVGTNGCVSFMFDRKGQIIVDKEEYEGDADELMMTALDAGAEDFSEEEDCYEIYTDPDSFSEVREALEQAGVPMASAEVTMIPQNYVDLTSDNDVKLMNRILDMLDDDDDVQEVYHNWNQPEEEDED